MIRFHHAAIAAPNLDQRPALFPRVIVGIDFSPASLAAGRWAIEHIARNADAMLAHVVPFSRPPDEDGDSHTPSQMQSPLTPALSGGLGGFGATLAVASARTAVRVGRPSHWLDMLALESNASLIIVGRRTDANRRRIGEANVVERLTRRANVPVLVVPEGANAAPRCVVAAIDDGPSGAEVLDAAAALAAASDCPLIAVHVLAPALGAYERVIDVGGRRRGDRAARSDLALSSSSSRIAFPVGDPARELVATATAHGGGLLVVGKRGADDAPVGSIGSVARALLATAPLPVLAIDIPSAMGWDR